ncbi:MAG TPA: hypothetical protein VLC74_05220 [Rhizomicrobium sp.]|nr:hypothetical protein [Rhizomicrobium sp.]
MRALLFATFILFIAAEAVAQSVIVPHPVADVRQRMERCVSRWNAAPAAERGSITDRQFTANCLEGRMTTPVAAVALCRNGTTAPATASAGACAYDGGIERWMD